MDSQKEFKFTCNSCGKIGSSTHVCITCPHCDSSLLRGNPNSISPVSDFDWKEECQYISDMTDAKGMISDMSYDLDIALCYAKMQKQLAETQGRFDSAEYIQHCIDDLEG